MVIDFHYFNGGGGSGSGVTPEEVQAQIDSALTGYYTSGQTDNAITSATSTKQDTLTAGANINISTGNVISVSGLSTINGSAITGGGDIVIQGGGGSANIIELTKAEYAALTSYTEDTIYVITDADAIDMNDYALSGVVSGIAASLSGAIDTKAAKASVSANSNRQFPKWNAEGVVTGTTGNTVYEQNLNINGTQKTMLQTTNSSFGTIYAPTAAGTANQPLLSNGSGAPVWGTYKFQFISQAAYDALVQGGTVDATTIYFIVSES